MKAMFLTIFLLAFLCGCSEEPRLDYEWDCSEHMQEGAQFIQDCIANANPKSDEEPEDWIRHCEHMMQNLYCKKIYGFRMWDYDDYSTHFIPCSKASEFGVEAISACRGITP